MGVAFDIMDCHFGWEFEFGYVEVAVVDDGIINVGAIDVTLPNRTEEECTIQITYVTRLNLITTFALGVANPDGMIGAALTLSQLPNL